MRSVRSVASFFRGIEAAPRTGGPCGSCARRRELRLLDGAPPRRETRFLCWKTRFPLCSPWRCSSRALPWHVTLSESAQRILGEIIVETYALRTDFQTWHAVEVDRHGTALRALCGAVRVEEIGMMRFGAPTCPQCVRIDALPVRCPRSSPRWLDLELRRLTAEPLKTWLDNKEKAERDAEAKRAEAERVAADAAQEERDRHQREKDEEQRAWAKWRRAQHVSLSAREREWEELLRRDWAEHDVVGAQELEELIYSVPGDCGGSTCRAPRPARASTCGGRTQSSGHAKHARRGLRPQHRSP